MGLWGAHFIQPTTLLILRCEGHDWKWHHLERQTNCDISRVLSAHLKGVISYGCTKLQICSNFFELHFPLAFLVSLSFSVLGHHLKPPPHNVHTCVHIHTSATQVAFTGCWRCLVWEHRRSHTEKWVLHRSLLAFLLSFLLSLTGCQTRGCQTREVPRTYNLSLACGQSRLLGQQPSYRAAVTGLC